MTAIAFLLLAIIAGCIQAKICPLVSHTICNNDGDEEKCPVIQEHCCVCAMSLADEPAPGQSCNGIVKPDEQFSAVSVKLRLDQSANELKIFPEDRFKRAIASSLQKVNDDQIIVLRAKCATVNEDEDSKDDDPTDQEYMLIVQFAIKKKETLDEIPYTSSALIPAQNIVDRMKSVKHLADLEVIEIEKVIQLVPVEGVGDNMKLGFIALAVGVGVIISCALGVFNVLRTNRYSDIDNAEA